jgi:hypothetical protein
VQNYSTKTHFAQPNHHVLTLLHAILMCPLTSWAPLRIQTTKCSNLLGLKQKSSAAKHWK